MHATDRGYQVDHDDDESHGHHILRDPMVHDLHARVTKLEHTTSEDRTNIAVMLNDLSYVKKEVTGISKGVKGVLWSILMSVIAAASTFILTGGLSIVGH